MKAIGRARIDAPKGPEPERTWRVGEVAKMAHVTVRTLHHYDEIGLLEPSGRTASGYRCYSEGDLQRLQQVMLFRELGFTLEAIQQLLEGATFDRRKLLEAQREMLIEQSKRTQAILRGVDRALADLHGERAMSGEEMFEGFEEFNKQYEDEVQERWGDTEAYRESMRRTKRYTKEDWKRFTAESEATAKLWVEAKAGGVSPTSAQAMDLAEAARLQIDQWFYPCPPAMHRNLANMYEADPRFSATYEKMATGMTAYVSTAIRANAERQERRVKK